MKKLINLIQQKKIADAIKHLNLIKNNLSERDELFFKALLYQLDGNNEFAIEYYSKVLIINNFDIGSTINLSNIFNSLEKYEEALVLLKKLNDFGDSREPFTFALFDAHFGLRKYEQSLKIIENLKLSDLENSAASERKAAALMQLDRIDEAILLLEKLVPLFGKHRPQIFGNLAAAYNKNGQYTKALEASTKAINLDKGSWQLKLNLAVSLMCSEQLNESKKILIEILNSSNNNIEVLVNIARVDNLLGNINDSINWCKKALQIEPQNSALLGCLADNYAVNIKGDDYYRIYEEALNINPNDNLIKWHLALNQLKDEKFSEGWVNYNYGFKNKMAGRGIYRHEKTMEWDGIKEIKKLVVWGEQGIGDEVMFSKFIKYIPESIEVIFHVDERLVEIFKRRYITNKNIQIAGHQRIVDLYHIPVGNLPSLYWNNYFNDSDRKEQFFLRNNRPIITPKKRIGITWRGGRPERLQRKRSIPLGLFKRINNLLNHQIVVLQYNSNEEEIKYLKYIFHENLSLPNYDPLLNVSAWVDHIDSCDYILSVDNSVIHFSGAMGIPTLALIPDNPDFRWGRNSVTNHWYSSLNIIRGSNVKELDELSVEVNNYIGLNFKI
jgi:tetratricopeptide (TPR) repeat protein